MSAIKTGRLAPGQASATAGALAAARSPVTRLIAGCLALALLSAALLPTVPSYDPWAWIVWGREVFDPHLSFATGGGPSWKPLPVLFTAVYGPLGGAAPTLWVITARAGGLLALAGAWRLGARFSGWIAGLVALLGVLLTQDFVYYLFRGTSEPLLIGCVLWAVERHLAGRRRLAYVLVVGAALVRPEAWPFLGLYGLWLWRREPGLRIWILAGLAAIPLFWFVPPWIGSGQPFLAASHAKSYNGHLGHHPWLEALRRAGDLQILPVLIAAAAGVVLAWRRDHDRVVVLGLLLGALSWVVLVVAMVILGYPGLERFFLPASALFCVLGGVGVARLAAEAEPVGGRRAVLAGAALLVALSVPLAASRISSAWSQRGIADRAVTRLDALSGAVRSAGGHAGVLPCRSSVAAVNHAAQTALAWKLHVTLSRVETTLRHPGVLFVGPHDSIDGSEAPVKVHNAVRAPALRQGPWAVFRVTHSGSSGRCVGASRGLGTPAA